ncbi:hypothetical protein KFU94_57955 [Chloroflexi bacterium TSY]|nr:hypothetical protein [Chloroflexi bacterium TSY]
MSEQKPARSRRASTRRSSSQHSGSRQSGVSTSGARQSGKGQEAAKRRRYFRWKKNTDSSSEKKSSSESSSSSRRNNNPESTRQSRNSRVRQKRRRRRDRRRERSSAPTLSERSILDDIQKEYKPPSSVFVYTHVVRPNFSNGGYEFRSDHFNKPSRTIDDYNIDLSDIVGTILEQDPERRPKLEWNWGLTMDETADEGGDSRIDRKVDEPSGREKPIDKPDKPRTNNVE